MNKTAFILAAAMAATVAASGFPAFAQPVEPAPSVRVSFADLDLSQAAGRATLETRIKRAVSHLCQMPYSIDLDAIARYRACRKAAWSGARVQLAAIYGDERYAQAPVQVAAK